MSATEHPVLIVGGGFAGTMVAAQLAKRGIKSILVEGGGRAGRGTAYSTREGAHLLNVRAGSMSAWPDQPDDFSAALRGEGTDADEAKNGFAQRRRFGTYLGAILDEALASGLTQVVEQLAVAAEPADGGWRVTLNDGTKVLASDLVLATGNQPPQPLPAKMRGDWLIDDPWSLEGQARVAAVAESGVDLLVVGTGLSMVDMVLTLASHGHNGLITAVSRRGLIPKGHGEPGPVDTEVDPPKGLRPLWRWVRARMGNEPWRNVIDSLRPHSHAIWQGFTRDEQKRFMRHARPWWDVHRHRIAPQVSKQLADRVAAGQLEIMAGRIKAIEPIGDEVRVTIGRRGGGERHVAVGAVINCTGPLGAVARTDDPLVRSLLDAGLVEPDALGLGLKTDAGGDRVKAPAPIWAPGALSKGSWWENTAVPDLRGQCERMAAVISGSRTSVDGGGLSSCSLPWRPR